MNIKLPAVIIGVLALYVFLLSPSETEAVARVGAGGTAQALGTTLNVTIPATTAGNTLIAVIGVADNNGNRVSGITGGGTWIKAISGGNANGAIEADIWYCPNISAGVTTVTVTLNAAFDMGAVVQEYAGVLTSSPVDQTAINNTTAVQTSSQTSGTTAATSCNNELWVAGFAAQANGAYSGPGAGWSIANQAAGSNVSTAMLDDMSNTVGTASASVTGPVGFYVGATATFLSAWNVSWIDAQGNTTYSFTAPCKVFISVPFNITAAATDTTCPDAWVGGAWQLNDNSTLIPGEAGDKITTVSGQWQRVKQLTYTGTPVNHTLEFKFWDLGRGVPGQCDIGGMGWQQSSIGDVTVDPFPPAYYAARRVYKDGLGNDIYDYQPEPYAAIGNVDLNNQHIECMTGQFMSITYNNPGVEVLLEGGYDANFIQNLPADATVIDGITIVDGTMVIGNLSLGTATAP